MDSIIFAISLLIAVDIYQGKPTLRVVEREPNTIATINRVEIRNLFEISLNGTRFCSSVESVTGAGASILAATR